MELKELENALPCNEDCNNLLKEIKLKKQKNDHSYREELCLLERKYDQINQLLYEERAKIVNTIPNFWRTVLLNHPVFENIISDQDKEALSYLRNLFVKYDESSPSFTLGFEFSDNQFFSNKILEKEFRLLNSSDTESPDIIFEDSKGTEILWKDGNNLCFSNTLKTQRNKKTGLIRKQEICSPKPSFFHFFGDIKYITSEDNDQEISEFEDNIEAEMELAEIIKSSIFPDAHIWFLNEGFNGSSCDEYCESDENESSDDCQSTSSKKKEQCKQQ
jgi:nucleosome assembly protein 1-like 1